MISQSKEVDISTWIICMTEQSLPKTVFTPTNRIILPLHLSSKHQALLVLNIARKTRNQWKYDIHSKILLLLNRFQDS
jgi:hypothetical protein